MALMQSDLFFFFLHLRTSPTGIVPKKTGGWRLITYRSAPGGYSINDFIDPYFFTVKYASFDEAITLIQSQGQSCLIAISFLTTSYPP